MSLRLGRYETVRAIASGGMATVHLGRAVGAGGFERLVAIKVLHPHVEAEPDFVAMFLDEARLAAQIRHPNVVATIDVSEQPLFLVMEYVEGPSLHLIQRKLRKDGVVVPIEIALRIATDVLAGLHAAHELTDAAGVSLGLVHRDVSPHNVLIGTDGVSRLTDFGVARAEARLSSTRGGQIKGKLAYMSPEQVGSAPLDRRSDVYAAGVVLHELLTNRPCFSADNDAALVVQVAAGPSKSPRDVNPAVPEAIDAVCMKALSPAMESRYANASDFADAIEEAARASGIHIASTKAVATFVKQLGVHQAASTRVVPAASASHPGAGSSPGSAPGGSSPGTPSGGLASRGGASSPGSRPDAAPGRESFSSASQLDRPSGTSVGTVVASDDAVVLPIRRSPMRVLIPLGAAVVLVVGYFALRGGDATLGEGATSTGAAAAASAPPKAAQTATSTALPVPPETASAAASSSAAPSATASAAKTSRTAAAPTATGRPRPDPRATSTAFRPGGL